MLIRVYIVETFDETTRRLFIESLCRNETFPAYYIVLETHRTVDRSRGPNSSYAGHHQIGSNVSLCRNIVRRPNESYNQKFPVVSGEAMVARGRFELPSMGLFLVRGVQSPSLAGSLFSTLASPLHHRATRDPGLNLAVVESAKRLARSPTRQSFTKGARVLVGGVGRLAASVSWREKLICET